MGPLVRSCYEVAQLHGLLLLLPPLTTSSPFTVVYGSGTRVAIMHHNTLKVVWQMGSQSVSIWIYTAKKKKKILMPDNKRGPLFLLCVMCAGGVYLEKGS